MLIIKSSGDTPINPENKYAADSTQWKIFDKLQKSEFNYAYDSETQLEFEINLRSNIIEVSKELNKSKFAFAIFRKSFCNEEYWERTEEGGFKLKSDKKPYEAVKDIFINSGKYGTECATAMVIVYCKALLNVYPEELYNKTLADLYLMNWSYLDKDLGIRTYGDVKDFLPGDCRYFKNPDVDPAKPEWQGENAIDLGDGTYYGHGIGIKTSEGIIEALNRNRKEGSEESAYLMDTATRLDFRHLWQEYESSQA